MNGSSVLGAKLDDDAGRLRVVPRQGRPPRILSGRHPNNLSGLLLLVIFALNTARQRHGASHPEVIIAASYGPVAVYLVLSGIGSRRPGLQRKRRHCGPIAGSQM